MVSMKGIGYMKSLHISMENIRDEACGQGKAESRRFAKRQLTRFRREKDTMDRKMNIHMMIIKY